MIYYLKPSSRSIFASWHISILFKIDHCLLALINLLQDGLLPLGIDRSSARSIIDSHYPLKLQCSMFANWSCSELIILSHSCSKELVWYALIKNAWSSQLKCIKWCMIWADMIMTNSGLWFHQAVSRLVKWHTCPSHHWSNFWAK